MKTWVLIADGSRARIFTTSEARSPLAEIKDLVHGENRRHERDLTSDLPGRRSGGSSSNRHALDSETGVKKQEIINFSKYVNQQLDQGRKDRHYDQLIIASAPSFLGMLRENMSSATSKLVSLELNKDLSKMSAVEIRKHLPESLYNVSA